MIVTLFAELASVVESPAFGNYKPYASQQTLVNSAVYSMDLQEISLKIVAALFTVARNIIKDCHSIAKCSKKYS